MGCTMSTTHKHAPPQKPSPRSKKKYDYSQCKPGCLSKVYNEKIDPKFLCAIRQSSICNIALTIQLAANDEMSLFTTSMLPQEVILYMRNIYIEYAVQERIEESCSLSSHPWRIETLYWNDDKNESLHYRLHVPKECEYGLYPSRHACISNITNNGRSYSIPNFFWEDTIYYTDICKCDAWKAKQKALRAAKIEAHLEKNLIHMC